MLHFLQSVIYPSPVGTVSTVAGTGEPKWKDGSGEEACFNSPQGIAGDGDDLLVADCDSHSIRKITIKGTFSFFHY